MPQMMPLMWVYMMIFSTIMLLILTSFLYFFMPPLNLNHTNKFLYNDKNMKKTLWNWKW